MKCDEVLEGVGPTARPNNGAVLDSLGVVACVEAVRQQTRKRSNLRTRERARLPMTRRSMQVFHADQNIFFRFARFESLMHVVQIVAVCPEVLAIPVRRGQVFRIANTTNTGQERAERNVRAVVERVYWRECTVALSRLLNEQKSSSLKNDAIHLAVVTRKPVRRRARQDVRYLGVTSNEQCVERPNVKLFRLAYSGVKSENFLSL